MSNQMGEISNTVEIEDLESAGDLYRAQGKKVVLCHGVFDLLHLGHLRHLEHAKRNGDVLFVSITEDRFVNKGPHRPVFGGKLRAEMLSGLSVVDHVVISLAPTGLQVIEKLRPDFYVKGVEYREMEKDITKNISKEVSAVEAYGGQVIFTEDVTFSSSNLVNDHFDLFPPETKNYLSSLKSRYSDDDILAAVGRTSGFKVAVVGDSIIDRYVYCTPLGKSAKGSFITVKRRYVEEQAGGAIAVANHIAQFVSEVSLVTGLGGDPAFGDNYESFIREKLADNVTPEFFTMAGNPTLVKERFVDADMNKLFEVYVTEDGLLQRKWRDGAVVEWLSENIGDYDVVVVPDYGNGFITDSMVDVICDKSKFLAVNTQLNSGNQGFHAITRYRRADFVSLNEPELRLGCHDPLSEISDLAEKMASRLKSKCLSVTLGARGVATVCQVGDRFDVPALASKVVDRVGAGDAFLALASICHGAEIDEELATFIGSVSAALDIQIVGNSEYVGSVALQKYIVSLLK
jgi:rfaE bifunctional protein nucleotidyltransferase chain/domain